MKKFTMCWLLSLTMIASCSHIPVADLVAVAETELLNTLALRDTKILDLAQVGQELANKYGKSTALAAVQKAWDDQSKATPKARVADVMWLQDQPPRVRDIAWLLHYQTEWLK
jgi:hypothetical protein